MSVVIKKITQDETRIGEYAANQPLSGIHIVQTARVKGYSNMGFTRAEETTKKAS